MIVVVDVVVVVVDAVIAVVIMVIDVLVVVLDIATCCSLFLLVQVVVVVIGHMMMVTWSLTLWPGWSTFRNFKGLKKISCQDCDEGEKELCTEQGPEYRVRS
jgi:hypothetical protein